ncbi:MAG: hypothetical protein AAF518_29075 [Spirochaetota bacterium]
MIPEEDLKLWRELHSVLAKVDFKAEFSGDLIKQQQTSIRLQNAYRIVMNLEGLGWDGERYLLAYKNNIIEDIIHSPLNGYVKGWRLESKEATQNEL